MRCLTHALSIVEKTAGGTGSRRAGAGAALEPLDRAEVRRGYAAPEVEQNLDRVFMLSRADGRGQVPVRWLWAAFTLRFMLGDLKGTREVSEQALARSVVRSVVPLRSASCDGRHAC